jgi:hypothetical protein
MKIEAWTFLGTGLFAALIGLIYWFTSHEPTGTTLLGLVLGLGALPGIVFLRWGRRMGPRPEDRKDATIDEGAGTVGSFQESSIWPFVIAGGAAFTAVGLVFGLWAALPGLILLAIAFIGGTMESRGTHE